MIGGQNGGDLDRIIESEISLSRGAHNFPKMERKGFIVFRLKFELWIYDWRPKHERFGSNYKVWDLLISWGPQLFENDQNFLLIRITRSLD